MKKNELFYLLLIAFALQNTVANAQSIKAEKYEMKVNIDIVKRNITAKTIITAFSPSSITDTLKLILHKNSTIQKVKVEGKNCKYLFAVSDKQANRYMPESRDLIIVPNEKLNGKFTIEIDYTALRQVLCMRIEATPLKHREILHNLCTKLGGGQYI